MYPKSVIRAVEDYCAGLEGYRYNRSLVGSANAVPFYGQLSAWLDEIGTLYVDENSGCVSTREPDGKTEYCSVADDMHAGEPCPGHYIEPMPYYALEGKEIGCILFGDELAEYL